MSRDDELSRAIEMYAAAVDSSVAAAEAYDRARIALDVAYRNKVAIQESRTPKE